MHNRLFCSRSGFEFQFMIKTKALLGSKVEAGHQAVPLTVAAVILNGLHHQNVRNKRIAARQSGRTACRVSNKTLTVENQQVVFVFLNRERGERIVSVQTED